MKREAFKMFLKPGFEKEYEKRHAWRYIAGEAYPTQAGHSIGIIHR